MPRKSVNSVTLTGLSKTISGQNNRLNRLSSLSKKVINVKKTIFDFGTCHSFNSMEEFILTSVPYKSTKIRGLDLVTLGCRMFKKTDTLPKVKF